MFVSRVWPGDDDAAGGVDRAVGKGCGGGHAAEHSHRQKGDEERASTAHLLCVNPCHGLPLSVFPVIDARDERHVSFLTP